MNSVYTAKQIQIFEKSLFVSEGEDLKLMRQAASESVDWLKKKFSNCTFIIICGPGNNGGDGYFIGLGLSKLNFKVQFLDAIPEAKKSYLCNLAFNKASDMKFVTSEGFDKLAIESVVIDAIFGIGGRINLSKEIVSILERTKKFKTKIAIDLPTGLCANTGKISQACFNANNTITFIGLKLGQLINQGKIYCGKIILRDLELDMTKTVKPAIREFNYKDIKSNLPVRKKNTHKGKHGKLLVVAGDEGYGGAGILASEAALKTGAGLVKLLTRESHVSPSLAKNPEVMVSGADNAQDLEHHFLCSDVLVCGPGMFENYWSEQLLFKLITFAEKNQTPTLLDAGALRLLSNKPFSTMSLPKNIVLTPHPGEASSLLGVSNDEVQNDRLKAAKDLHSKFGGVIVLKGHGTIICDSEESYLCSSGGPELAVAGSGDILSGVIGSLMAQGLKPLDAAVTGVALHSNAGEFFAKNTGEIGLAASELIPHIRNALN